MTHVLPHRLHSSLHAIRQRLWRPRPARQQLGQRSEALAVRFLRSHGYTIEQINVRFRVGEIDIVAREGVVLCFVEVRSTSSSQWGGPLASITDQKRRRLIRAAEGYLSRCRSLPRETRFDVVAVSWDDPAHPKLELVRGAFDAS